jgi:hypothetical protein
MARQRSIIGKAVKAAKKREVPTHNRGNLNVKSGRASDWSRRDQRYSTGRFTFNPISEQ